MGKLNSVIHIKENVKRIILNTLSKFIKNLNFMMKMISNNSLKKFKSSDNFRLI
jgi:hypothetical protein